MTRQLLLHTKTLVVAIMPNGITGAPGGSAGSLTGTFAPGLSLLNWATRCNLCNLMLILRFLKLNNFTYLQRPYIDKDE